MIERRRRGSPSLDLRECGRYLAPVGDGQRARGARVELRDVVVRRGGRTVLDGVSLTVEPDELLVVIGPSGAGKSTLLSAINRLIEIDEGSISIDGREVCRGPAHSLRRQIGYCFQDLGLFPHLTGRDNVGVTPSLLGWDRARIDARVDELLARVDLDPEHAGRLPRELSGGQAQRVAVARALAADPPLLLLDEPFGALDPETRARLQDELARVQRELRVTAIMVSHDLAEALLLATRIAVVVSGEIVAHGLPSEIVESDVPEVVALIAPARERARRLRELG
jgi:osmoprotectant transport system ATP-binding protein